MKKESHKSAQWVLDCLDGCLWNFRAIWILSPVHEKRVVLTIANEYQIDNHPMFSEGWLKRQDMQWKMSCVVWNWGRLRLTRYAVVLEPRVQVEGWMIQELTRGARWEPGCLEEHLWDIHTI
jgi:hypothetical protein